eukprot:759584_1
MEPIPAEVLDVETHTLTHSVSLPRHMYCRLLYPNPVCLLTSGSIGEGVRNVMTISWLTPINSSNMFVMSINQRRFSAEIILKYKCFVLNVPTKGQEDLIRSIGSCSGRDEDKFSKFGLSTCRPGRWAIDGEEEKTAQSSQTSDSFKKPSKKRKRKKQKKRDDVKRCGIALNDTVAHLECSVLTSQSVSGHCLLTCRIDSAFVRSDYWNERNFAPVNSEITPPCLTFLGTRRFGYITVPTTDTVVTSMDKHVSAADKIVSATDKMVSATDETVSGMDGTVSAADKMISATDETVSATDKMVSAMDETASAVNGSVSAMNGWASVADPTVSVTARTVSTADQTVLATDESMPSTNERSSDTNGTLSTAERTDITVSFINEIT